MHSEHAPHGCLLSLFESLQPMKFFAPNRPNGASGERANCPTGARSITPSVIAIDSVVRGSLVSSGDIYVEGTITGGVRATVVVVGSSGLVEAFISGRTVTIYGRVIGMVHADHVCLMPGCRVEGDVISCDLSVQWGAMLEGRCLRNAIAPTLADPTVSAIFAEDLPALHHIAIA